MLVTFSKPIAFLAVIGLVVAASGEATAATPKAHSLLAEAQQRSKKGDHQGAAKLLEKARAADPGNAEVLSELGWQLFLAHDLARALAATQQALAASPAVSLKAASLYNLGRIDEALGRKEEAVKAYVDSLAQRPTSRTVLARLATLDAKRAAELDPGRPRPLDGPFASIAAWCAQLGSAHCDSVDDTQLIAGLHEVAAPQPPYRAVRVFVVFPPKEDGLGDCALAIQLKAGWFVGRLVETCRESMFRKPVTQELSLSTMAGITMPLIEWSLQIDIAERDSHMEWIDKDPELHSISCAIGPSGKPSCGEPYKVEPTSFP